MLRKLFGIGRSGGNEADNNPYNIDTDCNYCPKCEEEYRAEIKTCASCSVPLMPGSEKLAILRRQETDVHSDFQEITADDELVTLQTGKLLDLKELQQLLKKAHIPSMLAGEDMSKG